MAKLIDETGHKYTRLTVLYRVENKNNRVRWHCKCDCGNEIDVDGVSLRSGNTKSCGCLQKEKVSNSLKDLTGQRFGELTVIERDKSKPSGHGKLVYWICKCDCGNIISVAGNHLKSGHTKSCGCYKPTSPFFINEVGNKYGMLTVINEAGRDKNGRVLWNCLCDCGNEKIALGKSLRAGLVTSCGCIHSKGEFKIKNLLNEIKIKYISQYHIDDLKSKNNYHLYFDFFLPDYNIIIEYQGEQHYHPLNYEIYDEDNYKKLQERDNLKREYCKNHNIKLIEIPYTDYDNLDINYLKGVIK